MLADRWTGRQVNRYEGSVYTVKQTSSEAREQKAGRELKRQAGRQ